MDIVTTVYRHRHHHANVPAVEIMMHEANTENDWLIRAAVHRSTRAGVAYLGELACLVATRSSETT